MTRFAVIESECDCIVSVLGMDMLILKGNSDVIPINGNGTIIIKVYGLSDTDEKLPVVKAHYAVIEEGKLKESTLEALDWGDIIEFKLKPEFILRQDEPIPTLLDSVSFSYGSGNVSAELYSEQGIRLDLIPERGEPMSLSIGFGKQGRLRTLDVGRQQLLCVDVESENRYRSVYLSGNAEKVLDIFGDLTGITDGRPFSIERIQSVRGYERRCVYDYAEGGFRSISNEVGFFSRKEHIPDNDTEKALSVFEDIIFDPGERWRAYLSSELTTESSRASVADFFGEYDCAVPFPVEEPGGCVTIGLIKKGDTDLIIRPLKYRIWMREGAIADIEEL